ncbi:MAG: hypothetical protein ACLQBD_24925 [Syntrophobacteraceae bacterium]
MAIQKIFGETSETTTERYLYNTHRDLQAVMELLGRGKSSDAQNMDAHKR